MSDSVTKGKFARIASAKITAALADLHNVASEMGMTPAESSEIQTGLFLFHASTHTIAIGWNQFLFAATAVQEYKSAKDE